VWFVLLGCLVVLVVNNALEMRGLESCPESTQLEQHAGCNRQVNLCSKKYNEIVYATMHNAFATTQDGILFAQHRGCMKMALKQGIRAFMLDVHMIEGQQQLRLCHNSCIFGSVSFEDTLLMFKEFIVLNPREVVTIIWEVVCAYPCERSRMYTMWAEKMKESGLLLHAFRKRQDQVPWLTLEEMIRNNTQLVSFSDFGYDLEEWDLGLDVFTVENPYDSATVADLNKPCTLRRYYKTWKSSWTPLLIMNRFLTIGALGVNTYKAFGGRANLNKNNFMENVLSCSDDLGQFPSFLVVDFWESSVVLDTVNSINKLPVFQNNNTDSVPK
jgi:hypothetical protein